MFLNLKYRSTAGKKCPPTMSTGRPGFSWTILNWLDVSDCGINRMWNRECLVFDDFLFNVLHRLAMFGIRQ